MALSENLVSQFAKLSNDKKDTNKTESVKGTYKKIGDTEYVQIDGSEIWTPVKSTVEAKNGEQVKVEIKNHIATITGNISNPSASSTSVSTLADTVDEHGNTIKQMNNTITEQGSTITVIDSTLNTVESTVNQYKSIVDLQEAAIKAHDSAIEANKTNIEINSSDIKSHGDQITSLNTTINAQNTTISTMDDTIKSQGNQIILANNTLEAYGSRIQTAEDNITSQGNKITLIDNTVSAQGNDIAINNSNIQILNSGFKIENGKLTGLSAIVVDDLTTNTLDAKYLTATNADIRYAQIDFANIDMAAVEKLFADSGIIKDLVVEEGAITGELVGVTIKGDLIQGNTIVADKLVVLGEDGLYYKLNNLGVAVEDEQTQYNSLNGSVITAKTITATKINVSDLVAFGATIGGFHITDDAIYSKMKNAIDNQTQGLYMNSMGELNLGDSNSFIKYYKKSETYDLLAEEPEDWADDYSSYYIYNAELEAYTPVVAEEAPEFTTDTYYRRTEIYAIEISADELKFSTSSKTIDEEMNDMRSDLQVQITNNDERLTSLSNIFQLTSGSNLIQNSVGYLSTGTGDNATPTMWTIADSTVNYKPFGYDDDLIGRTVSRGQLTIANGSMTTTDYNICEINTNSTLSLSFKYKNASDSTSKVKLYNGDIIYFEQEFTEAVEDWTEVKSTFDILGTSTLYLEISSTNTDVLSTEGVEISDLMLNYGDVKAWELHSNEVFSSIIKLSSLGITVTATTAKTVTYMTTDGIQVYHWTPDNSNPYKGVVGDLITKLTDSGVWTNEIYASGDIIKNNLVTTLINDEDGHDVYVEYIRNE